MPDDHPLIKSIAFFGMGLILSTITSCTSSGHQDRYSDEYQFKGFDPENSQVTGTACARQSQDAVQAAKKAASFNLRSVLGSQRILIHFKELKRYPEGNQICVTMIAIAQKP